MSIEEPIVRRDGVSSVIYLREVALVAFFVRPPIADVAGALLTAFDHFIEMLPPGVLKWEAIGASVEEWRRVDDTTIRRCRAQLTGQAVHKRRLTAFHLVDGWTGADAAEYGCKLIGPGKVDSPDEMCLLEMSFPVSLLTPEGVDVFVEGVNKIGSSLPYVSGYASPSLQWAEMGRERAFVESRGISAIYPGYDVSMNSTGRLWIGDRVRGARWLSFVGPTLVTQLGGAERLRTLIPPEVTTYPAGHGLMIRAGTVPEVGGRGSVSTTPLLREVARALEPVTAFREVVLLGSFADWDEERLQKWERRFLQ